MNAIVRTLLVWAFRWIMGVTTVVHSFSSQPLLGSSNLCLPDFVLLPTFGRRDSVCWELHSTKKQPCEANDDDYYDEFPQTREFRERTSEEMELRSMAPNSMSRRRNDRQDYDEDESRPIRRNKNLNLRSERYNEEDYDDEIDLYDDESVAGNFWSNPTSRMDRPSSRMARRGRRQQIQRRYDDDEDEIIYGEDESEYSNNRRRRRPSSNGRRSKVPSGFGEPPRVLKDFYDQLFWYGFDVDESADVGDKTAFGGTKGKFNGFNYLLEDSEAKENRRRPVKNSRRLPPSENRRAIAASKRTRDDSLNYYDEDDYDDFDSKPRSSLSYTPPTDKASTRKSQLEDDDFYDEIEDDYYDERDDYTVRRRPNRRSNSPRFDYDEEDLIDRRSGGRRRRRRQQGRRSESEWSPLNMIESFLGIDREEMEYKAEMYDAKMGLKKRNGRYGPPESRRRPRRLARDDPGRPGYAYRYDATEDADEPSEILDVDLAFEDDLASANRGPRTEARKRQLSRPENENPDAEKESRRKERSWEERQVAMEQVPPADVTGWGPSGELSMSAREKAFLDAQEDIEVARRRLKLLKQKESDSKEEIGILKVEAERQRLKLDQAPKDRQFRRDVEELRQIELDIDDASRELRQYRLRVQRASEKLEELEDRHHAILSCYNFGKASMLIGESLNEISASIPGTMTNEVETVVFSEADAMDEAKETPTINDDLSPPTNKE